MNGEDARLNRLLERYRNAAEDPRILPQHRQHDLERELREIRTAIYRFIDGRKEEAARVAYHAGWIRAIECVEIPAQGEIAHEYRGYLDNIEHFEAQYRRLEPEETE